MFVHLHTYSYYSFLRGIPSPAGLAQAAAAASMPALALTDFHGLSGAIEFYEACTEVGVRPLLGLELAVAPPEELRLPGLSDGPLVLLAQDRTGWSNLCRLSSQLLTSDERRNSLAFKSVVEHADGLVCLTGGWLGLVTRLLQEDHLSPAQNLLQKLAAAFPGRLYLELQPIMAAKLTQKVLGLGQKLNIPVTATSPVHYLAPEDVHLQKLLTAMRRNLPLDRVPPSATAPRVAHFTSSEEMATFFSEIPLALGSTLEIAERCSLDLPLGQPHYPQVLLPAGVSVEQELKSRAEQRAREIYGAITPDLRSRLDHELVVINESGYSALFLIMQEIVEFARKAGIPISSRGSAASSLVAHCLGITSPDPMQLNLYFERFLNPARATPPDIDTDLCSRRRDEVINFVYGKYGEERVAMVSTVNRFRRRSALREVAKAYGLSPSQVNRLAEALPRRWYGPPEPDSNEKGSYAVLAEHFSESPYPAIFRDAAALIGLPHHLSVHPGGIVIAPGPLTDLAPVQLASKGVVVTQFDLESVERLGLVKIDLLGIRGLTVIGDVAQAVRTDPNLSPPAWLSAREPEGSPETGAAYLLDLIPDGDPKTAELVREGRTTGCFQIESPGMQATLKEIRAESVDDIMVALALYRPGPLTGGLKDAFVRRHRGEEQPEHLHPSLATLLEDTYGVILYQEQVLRIAHELAGLSLADADLLRRAMSHFDPGKQMQTLKEKFIAGAYTCNQVPEQAAERIWDLMAAFAGYGFPKAHAASYAQVAWRAAWCKAHFPAVFMAAVLANWGGYYPQSVYLNEARRLGLALRPPHINHSRREFSVVYENGQAVLYMGLDQVRDLTRETQNRILRQRPYRSLADFLTRVDPRPGEVENLIKAGAMDGLGTIPDLLNQLASGPGWRKGQPPLFSADVMSGGAAAESAAWEEDWSLEQRVAAEQALLGASVSAHPVDLVADKVVEAGAITTPDAARRVGERVRVAGMRQTWRRSGTARGDYVYFMTMDDPEGTMNVFISAEVYNRNSKIFSKDVPFLVEGIVEVSQSGEEPTLRAEKLWRLVN